MALAAAGARFLLRGVTPGSYPRGGKVHLRLWLAERIAEIVKKLEPNSISPKGTRLRERIWTEFKSA